MGVFLILFLRRLLHVALYYDANNFEVFKMFSNDSRVQRKYFTSSKRKNRLYRHCYIMFCLKVPICFYSRPLKVTFMLLYFIRICGVNRINSVNLWFAVRQETLGSRSLSLLSSLSLSLSFSLLSPHHTSGACLRSSST